VLQNLSVAMTEVRSFVADNKNVLSQNIKGLNEVSKVLVKNRTALDQSLTYAPVALNNLFLAYNEKSGTLDTRANVGETVSQLTDKPSVVLCALLPDACAPLTSVLGVLGLGRTAALAGDSVARSTVVEPVDPTLGGLLAVNR
jgi:phospholipid/cholesterol/gamma-HCH transport system substrate-binding protein